MGYSAVAGALLMLVATAKGCVIPPSQYLPRDTVVLVDTIHAPPPSFSDAFRLECEWVREER